MHGALGSTLGSVEKRQVQKGHDKKRRKLTYTWVLELIFALNALNLNEVTAKLQQKSHFGKSLRAGVINCLRAATGGKAAKLRLGPWLHFEN